jgi:hypothetical protein
MAQDGGLMQGPFQTLSRGYLRDLVNLRSVSTYCAGRNDCQFLNLAWLALAAPNLRDVYSTAGWSRVRSNAI